MERAGRHSGEICQERFPALCGRTAQRTWTDRNGAEKTVTEIAGDSIELLGKTPAAQTDAAGKDGGNESSVIKNTWKPMPDIPETDDDLPF